jgi:hypothetical protein
MATDTPPPDLAARVRTMQIIAFAIILGPSIALALFAFLRTQGPPNFPNAPLLTYVAAGFAAVALVLHQVVPSAVVAAQGRRLAEGRPVGAPLGSPGDWYALYQVRLIMSLAILEGAAFFLAIVYYVEGTPLSLLLGVVLIAALVLHFPTAPRVERWVEAQRNLAG